MSERYDSPKVDPSPLAKPIKIGARTAQNVFLKAAMTERLSSWDQKEPSKRGIPSPELIRVYEEWGKGKFGIVLSGNVIVNPMDLEAPGNPTMGRGQDEPEREAAFKKLSSGAKAHGSLFITQLSHAGRQVAEPLQPNPVSASDVKLDDRMGFSFAKPAPLSKEGIKDIIDQFASAAVYAHKTGSDGIQLHAAHGYLLAQFLSLTTNKRTDEYGGSVLNRARIIFEIVDEIKKRIPEAGKDFILGIKINSKEYQDGGFQPEECREVCETLESKGVYFIELSGGTYQSLAFSHKRESSKARESFFLEFADVIRPAIKEGALYVTGGFRTADGMIKAIEAGSTQGIGLARPVCEEFDLPALLIDGKVHSARKSLIDDQDFGMGNTLAGTQIRQVGRGVKPLNSTDEAAVADFKKEVEAFQKKAQENGAKGIIEAGYPIYGA